MKVHSTKRISTLLEIGKIGYLIGAVASSLFWPAIAFIYYGSFLLAYLGFPLIALSLTLTGLSCFALGKLYDNYLAIITGVVSIIAAVPFFLMNNLLPSGGANFSNRSIGSIAYLIAVSGFSLLTLSLFMWAVTGLNIGNLSHHAHLAAAIFLTSVIAAIIITLSLSLSLWSPIIPTLLANPPYVMAEILSAVLLHKISSNTRQKP